MPKWLFLTDFNYLSNVYVVEKFYLRSTKLFELLTMLSLYSAIEPPSLNISTFKYTTFLSGIWAILTRDFFADMLSSAASWQVENCSFNSNLLAHFYIHCVQNLLNL